MLLRTPVILFHWWIHHLQTPPRISRSSKNSHHLEKLGNPLKSKLDLFSQKKIMLLLLLQFLPKIGHLWLSSRINHIKTISRLTTTNTAISTILQVTLVQYNSDLIRELNDALYLEIRFNFHFFQIMILIL